RRPRARCERPPACPRDPRPVEHDSEDLQRQDPALTPCADDPGRLARRACRLRRRLIVQVGCHLPVYGPAATRDVLREFARRMEALGYDSLWASDHVVIPYSIASRYPYNPTGDFPLAPATSFLEPLVALGLVAGVTARVRLVTTLARLPHPHPDLARKLPAPLDDLPPVRV